MNTEFSTIPRPALILGVGGLLPFFATAIAVCLAKYQVLFNSTITDFAVQSLGAYGAVILSFLGGIRWGELLNDRYRIRRWGPLSLSVVPSLIGWTALMLGASAMLLLLMAGFALQYTSDIAAVKRQELPGWYARLRLILTCGAVVSLSVAWIAMGLR